MFSNRKTLYILAAFAVVIALIYSVGIAQAQDVPAVEDVTDAYGTAISAIVAIAIAVVGAVAGVSGLAIWKFAPVVVALLEFLARLTARVDDDAAVAKLRAELERRGILPSAPVSQVQAPNRSVNEV